MPALRGRNQPSTYCRTVDSIWGRMLPSYRREVGNSQDRCRWVWALEECCSSILGAEDMLSELVIPFWVATEAEEDFAEPGVKMFDIANK